MPSSSSPGPAEPPGVNTISVDGGVPTMADGNRPVRSSVNLRGGVVATEAADAQFRRYTSSNNKEPCTAKRRLGHHGRMV